jgi:hypothetical protein
MSLSLDAGVCSRLPSPYLSTPPAVPCLPAEGLLLHWKSVLAKTDPDIVKTLASWAVETQPCNPLTLASGWVGVKCANVTTAPGQRRPAIQEM